MRGEQADVVVVGCGPAGARTAITLAQRGRRVIVLSGAALRSDTVAPRVMTPRAVAAVQRLGALDRVLTTGHDARLRPRPRSRSAAHPVPGTSSIPTQRPTDQLPN